MQRQETGSGRARLPCLCEAASRKWVFLFFFFSFFGGGAGGRGEQKGLRERTATGRSFIRNTLCQRLIKGGACATKDIDKVIVTLDCRLPRLPRAPDLVILASFPKRARVRRGETKFHGGLVRGSP